MRVAFIGPRHVGKSTASAAFMSHVKPRGLEVPKVHLAFADPLKNAYVQAFREFERAVEQEPTFTREELNMFKEDHRRELEDFGTKFGRGRFGDTLWIDLMEKEIQSIPSYFDMVVDDCRFLNEVALLKKYDFTLIRIHRSPTERGKSILQARGIANPTQLQIHEVLQERMPSEVELDEITCDYVMYNNGSENFAQTVRGHMNIHNGIR